MSTTQPDRLSDRYSLTLTVQAAVVMRSVAVLIGCHSRLTALLALRDTQEKVGHLALMVETGNGADKEDT